MACITPAWSSGKPGLNPAFSFGKYKVTPFCYRHLFVKSKRTQVPPIFIGPTALHHSKTKATYKKIVDGVTSATPGLSHKAKSFTTDGELPLNKSLEEGLTKAKVLLISKGTMWTNFTPLVLTRKQNKDFSLMLYLAKKTWRKAS